jgi:hypothetical protein
MTISESAAGSPPGLVGVSLHAASAMSATNGSTKNFLMIWLLRHRGYRRAAAGGALLR